MDRLAHAVLALTLLAACGGEGPEPMDAGVPLVAVGVETVVPETVRAGQVLNVTCLLVDETGETFTPPEDLREQLRLVPAASVERSGGAYIAIRAGAVEVACSFPELRLIDETPALVTILPGEPAEVVTTLDRDTITAGGFVRVGCEVIDAYGNLIEDAEAGVRASPSSERNSFEDDIGTFERAGSYIVSCEVAGAESRGARLEVGPDLPANLSIARVPDQPVYGRGQVIRISRIVTDRYDNPVTDVLVPVEVTGVELGDPELDPDDVIERLGEARFRFHADGRYTLTATVPPPTQDNIPLSESVEILVDGAGPAIRCDAPFDGQILDLAPGATIPFRGSVGGVADVASVRVNDTPVSIDAAGNFETTVETRFGINFVDVAAVNEFGLEDSQTCAFLVADVWARDDRTFADTVMLKLRQPAIDDGGRSGPINSLADILHRVLNSSGLRDTLHTSLLAANPLKPSSCDSRVLGVCVLRTEVIYVNSEINGPNTVQLNLVDGGLRAQVRLENLRVRLRVRGRAAGIPFDTTGWITFDDISVGVTFDVSDVGGRPQVRVRPGSVSTNVGRIRTSFSGLSGAIINIVVRLAQGTVRNLVANLVTGYVTDNFNAILDGVVGGLDVSTLGTSFDVPRLDGSGNVRLSFGIDFSHVNASSDRLLFGIATQLSSPPAHGRPTLGAPIPPGAVRVDPASAESTAAAIHVGVLNQALHALWRGGFLDVTLGTDDIEGGPNGLSAQLSTGLPPVAFLPPSGGDRIELSLGAMGLWLSVPELFADPIFVTLGARASMRARLDGDNLLFEDFSLDELRFSTGLTALDMSTRETLEGLFGRILGTIVESALNDALPALPIPSFELPASLSTFGIAPGTELGLTSPSFGVEPQHYILRGNFGEL